MVVRVPIAVPLPPGTLDQIGQQMDDHEMGFLNVLGIIGGYDQRDVS